MVDKPNQKVFQFGKSKTKKTEEENGIKIVNGKEEFTIDFDKIVVPVEEYDKEKMAYLQMVENTKELVVNFPIRNKLEEIVGKRLSQVPIEDEISQLTTAAAKVENEVDEEEEKSVESSSTKVDDDDFSAAEKAASGSISAPLSFLIGTFNESNTDYNQILKPQK